MFDDLDADQITPGIKETMQELPELGLPSVFGEPYLRKCEELGLHRKLSPEERAAIEKEIEEKGWNSLCRCTQADFNDADVHTRNTKAVMVNLYFEYGGNWAKVFRDDRSVPRRAMAVYWRDEIFRSYIEALDPILMLEARGVVVEVWKDGLDEKARLAAALQFLQAYDAKQWDRGVRKQIVANKGSLQNTLFTRIVSDDEVINSFIKDRLNKLPEGVRNALSEAVAKPENRNVTPTEAVSEMISAADMSKLQDPFGDDDEQEPE